MGWKIEFDTDVEKDFKKLNCRVQRKILKYLRERIANAADPRDFGKPLRGDLSGLWRYRIENHSLSAQPTRYMLRAKIKNMP